MLALYREISEMSKTIPDGIVKSYLNWVLIEVVVSNNNIIKGYERKYLL